VSTAPPAAADVGIANDMAGTAENPAPRPKRDPGPGRDYSATAAAAAGCQSIGT
jgi:hypothetical protein